MRTSFSLIKILVVSLVIGAISFTVIGYCNVNNVTAIVTGKERVTGLVGGKIESFYLVYTDQGTFKLKDDMFRGNFYSSDVYGRIRQDSTYNFKTSGYRIGVVSEYPNIIEVK
jgi:competence protein ComGC